MKTRKLTVLAFFLFFICQVFSQQEKDSVEIYRRLIKNRENSVDLLKSFVFFTKQKDKNLENKNFLAAANSLYYISVAEYNLSLVHNSESSIIEAIELLENVDDDRKDVYEVSIYNRLGIINRIREDYQESLKNYYKVVDLVKNKKHLATAYNNIGLVYRYKRDYSQALIELKKSYDLNIQIKDNDLSTARSLDNLGFVQGMLGDSIGLVNMYRALDIRKKNGGRGIYTSYKHLTEFFRLKKDTIQSLGYAKKAYEIAASLDVDSYKLDALRNLVDLNEFKYVESYNFLRDKIESERQRNENKYGKVKYDIKKEQEKTINAELRAIKNEAEADRNMLISILGAFGFILILIFLRRKHKNNTLKKQFETEQQISKKLHDVVANDVFYTMQKAQDEDITREQLVDDLEIIYKKTRDLSKANTEINVSEDYGQLLEDLIVSYHINDVNIFTNDLFEVPWDVISENKKRVLYRVIQELMTNMQKHSLADLVSFNFEKKGNKVITKYADNGVGSKLKKGNGLQNVESRIRMVNGSIKFESEINNGFHVQIIV